MRIARFLARIQIPKPVRRRLEPLPFPVRFTDGRVRLSTLRLALLRRGWLMFGAPESQQALANYRGGDVLDIGAFQGWYSVLLAPSACAGDHLFSFEPDMTAAPALPATLPDLGKHFTGVHRSTVAKAVGDVRRWPRAIPTASGAELIRARRTRPTATSPASRSMILLPPGDCAPASSKSMSKVPR